MARRPRLLLNATYFIDSYTAEISALRAQARFFRHVIKFQMRLEKEENAALRAYLEETYKLALSHMESDWEYIKAEDYEEEKKMREDVLAGTKEKVVMEEEKRKKNQAPLSS